ncbi:MAG: hypothetical protein JWO93_1607 [Micrococcaceae bacterium]|nr:hypothetical protein [Micrococcaceae bacterium]
MTGYLTYILLFLLGLLGFGIQLWAMVECLRSRAADFERAYKRTKGFWTGLTVAAAVVGGLYVLNPSLGFLLLLELASATAAGVFLADVRPALQDARRGGNRSQGPYGPW